MVPSPPPDRAPLPSPMREITVPDVLSALPPVDLASMSRDLESRAAPSCYQGVSLPGEHGFSFFTESYTVPTAFTASRGTYRTAPRIGP